MSTAAMVFGAVCLVLGSISAILAFAISAMEQVNEEFYGNGKETGLRQRDSEYRG